MKPRDNLPSVGDIFTLSIEPVGGGRAVQHPYSLGTDELVARQIAEERFRCPMGGPVAKTVTIQRNGRIRDVYDGHTWSSDFFGAFFDD